MPKPLHSTENTDLTSDIAKYSFKERGTVHLRQRTVLTLSCNFNTTANNTCGGVVKYPLHSVEASSLLPSAMPVKRDCKKMDLNHPLSQEPWWKMLLTQDCPERLILVDCHIGIPSVQPLLYGLNLIERAIHVVSRCSCKMIMGANIYGAEQTVYPKKICTRFCCALLCCGYAIVHNEFTWSIYPYSSGLLCWHWGNR